jgi:hypothetical protein
LEWIQHLFDGPTINLFLAVVLPVIGFVAIAGAARIFYERLKTRAKPADSNGARSLAGQPVSTLAEWAQKYYRTQGYEVLANAEAENPSDTLIAVKGEQRIAIRCLNEAEPATAEIISALAAARDQHHAQRAVLVSLTDFTDEMRQHAAALGVELREGPQVELMISVALRRQIKEGAVMQERTT